MAIEMVRKPSETPNIENTDDFVSVRYAYGNQDGYVLGRGTEVSGTPNGRNFTIGSGRLVLQGVECDIDGSYTVTIDEISTKRYYSVYLQVNLATNTVTIEKSFSTVNYPTISAGSDLTASTTGIANLLLYTFTAQNGVIADVTKRINGIKYLKEFVKETKVDNAVNADNATNATNATNAINVVAHEITSNSVSFKVGTNTVKMSW